MRLGAVVVASLLGIVKMSAQPTGSWDFNSSNLTATVGSALTFTDGPGGATDLSTTFGTTTGFGIADIAGSPAILMRFPAATNGQGYLMPTPAANGGGSTVNKYTLLMDVFYPTASGTKIRPLLRTYNLGGTEQYIFVDATGAVGPGVVGSGGIDGPYVGALLPNTWYRLGIVVDAGNVTRIYTNGVEMGSFTGGALDGFLALDPSSTAIILGTTSTNAALGYVNSVQLRDVALSGGQMQALGAASAAGIPSVIPPVPAFIASRDPGVGATGVSEEAAISVVLDKGDTTVTPGSVKLFLDGVQVGAVVEAPPIFTATYTVPPRLDPLSTHTLKLTWNDSVAGNVTNTWSFTVKSYQVVTLPAPFFFENFDSLSENATPGVALPAGWSVQNQESSPSVPFDLNDRGSDSYRDWILVSSTRFDGWDANRTNLPTIILNGSKLTTLASGNLLWAESDSRCGGCNGQFQDLFTSSISCVGKTNVFLAFNSIYMQNQDNMDFLEYSIDGGTSWLPGLYYFDNDPGNTDILLTGGGASDGPATFARVDDNSRNWSPDISPVHATNYGSYISAPTNIIPASAIRGRLNDSSTDGKRIEVIRLAAADGQANVKFRLNANGTSAWFWGIDDFGLYEINTPVFVSHPSARTVAAGTGTNFTVVVSSPTALTYQWQHEGTNISNGGHYSGVNTATLTISNADPSDAGAYRCKVTNSSGPNTSNPANLTVVTVPTITTQPIPAVVSDGYPASFTGAAFGGLPLTYQWRLNGTPVSSSTTYSIPSAHAADAGNYTLVVTNSYGSVTSRVAHLSVITVPVTNNLVAHLKFDGDYTDSTGHGNNGTPVNGPSLVAGKIGSALQFTTTQGVFPAVTNYVTLGYPTDLKFADTVNFSIAFWTKLVDQTDDLALLGNTQWDSSGNPGWGVFCQGGGNFRIKITSGAGGGANRTDITHGNVIRDGTWHHIVAVFEQGQALYTMLDGQSLATRIWTAGASGSVDTDGAGYVRNISGTDYFGAHAINLGQEGTGWYNDKNGGGITNGMMDDVGFWRRVLSPQEALAIYNGGQAGLNLAQIDQPASAGPLSITYTGGNANFSWIGATGVKLQKTTSLTPVISWSDVPGTTGASSYSEPATNSTAYYRLKKP